MKKYLTLILALPLVISTLTSFASAASRSAPKPEEAPYTVHLFDFVKKSGQHNDQLDVRFGESDTIGTLIERVEKQTGIPIAGLVNRKALLNPTQNLSSLRTHYSKKEEWETEPAMMSSIHLSVVPANAIKVQEMFGQFANIVYQPTDTIATLKEMYMKERGVPTVNQRWVWQNKQLEDGQTIGSYAIPAGSKIAMVMRMTPPAPAPAPADVMPAPAPAEVVPAPAPSGLPSAGGAGSGGAGGSGSSFKG